MLVVVGAVFLGLLLLRQYRKDEPLMPLKLITHTLPLTGPGIAMVAGAAVTALVELSVLYLTDVVHEPPAVAGSALATQVAGVVIAAWLFKRVIVSRWLPAFAFAGLAVVAGFLFGFGAGAAVAPALFMAGLSAPANRLGPTFALVELLRSEAAFLVAPVAAAPRPCRRSSPTVGQASPSAAGG